MTAFQIDPAFSQAVEDITTQLSKQGLPEDYVQVIAEYLGKQLSAESPDRSKDIFPDKLDIVTRYTIDGLQEQVFASAVADGTGSQIIMTAVQGQAIQEQVTCLLEIRRHYGRKKLPRIQKIIRAAHRRAIVTGEDGSVVTDLAGSVKTSLAASK